MLRPRVAHFGKDGISVSIDNSAALFDTRCELILNRTYYDAPAACKEAAKQLRDVAAAFDILARDGCPFREETAIAAMRLVQQPSGQEEGK